MKNRQEVDTIYNVNSENNKKWSKELLNELSKDYGILSKYDIEKKYNMKWNSIRAVCSAFKIKSNRNHKENPCCTIKYTKIRSEEKQFIDDWVEGILTEKELVEKYECPYTNITTRARELNIKRNKYKDKINIINLCEDYNTNMSIGEILEKYHISPSTLTRLLKDKIKLNTVGERNRIYSLNENYFDCIDTQIKAYYMGLFYADGSNNEKRGYISITLKEEDLYLLENLFKELEYIRPITEVYSKKYNSYYYMASISSRHISNIFKDYGCVQNKTFKIIFPNWLNESLYSHFIRGYFDGDGSISFPNKIPNKAALSFAGNKEFLLEIQKILTKNCNINLTNLHKTGNIYSLVISGKYQVSKVVAFLYKDANLYLHRKYNKIQQLKELNIIQLEDINGEKSEN